MKFRRNGRLRPFIKRWLTAAMLMVAALLAVLYVANAIRINELLEAITSLERERDQVRGENERLRGELLRLMSVERVSSIASERLGLVQPVSPPVALTPETAPAGATAGAAAGTDGGAAAGASTGEATREESKREEPMERSEDNGPDGR